MKKLYTISFFYFLFFSGIFSLQAKDEYTAPQKIKTLLQQCEALRYQKIPNPEAYIQLKQKASEGLNITPSDDASSRSQFYFYTAYAYYYLTKFDSAQYYFYQSLSSARRSGSTTLIAEACVALIPVNFQLQQAQQSDSCKDILKSILDTTHDNNILEDGYYALGTYYQQKAYYSTAQDFFIRSIELRKKEIDTTVSEKKQLDYAIQCYMLAKLYTNTDMPDKCLAMLNEGRRFSSLSPLVSVRYLSEYVEGYTLSDNIDSALYYNSLLNAQTANSPNVLSEPVSANLNIAQYYIKHKLYQQALPFLQKADTLSIKSKSPLLLFQAQKFWGQYFQGTGNNAAAIEILQKALPVAQQISKEQYAEALKSMALAQQAMGNSREALQYYQQYTKQEDSLTKEKISHNFADLETRYHTREQGERIAALRTENKANGLELANAGKIRWMLIIALIATGIILLLLYMIYRNREKHNKELNERNMQLAEANETKAKLFGIIGHDLRSPVSEIVQFLRIQKEAPEVLSESSKQQHNERLQQASENVLETMEDLLLWSKSQMQQFTPRMEALPIALLVDKEIELQRHFIVSKSVRVVNNIDKEFTQNTDRVLLEVIIRNLLQNAVKYSLENTSIVFSGSYNQLMLSNTSANKIQAGDLQKHPESMHTIQKAGFGLQLAYDLAARICIKLSYVVDEDNVTAILTWDK